MSNKIRRLFSVPLIAALVQGWPPLFAEIVIPVDPDPIIIVEPEPEPPPPPPEPPPEPPPPPPPQVALETATVTFSFDKHGPFHGELKKFLDWMGLAHDDQALADALRDFGKPCAKDKHGDGRDDRRSRGHGDDDAPPPAEPQTHTLDLLPLVDASWQGGIHEFRLVLTCRADAPDEVVLHLQYDQPVLRTHDGAAVRVPLDLVLEPSRVKLDSKRQFITARLELPAPYSPQDINRVTVRIVRVDDRVLEVPVRSSPQAFAFEDEDGDGVPELMLKFRYARLQPHLTTAGPNHFTLRGFLNSGEEFSTDYTRLVVRTKEHREVREKNGPAKVVIPHTAQTEALLDNVTVESDDRRDALRELKADIVKLKPAGLGCRFGPEGTTFQEPVQITLPYDPARLDGVSEDDLKIYYWNPVGAAWEALVSTVDTTAHTVTASVTHFSFYQVLAPAATGAVGTDIGETGTDSGGTESGATDPGFSLGDVYAFPNPVTSGAVTLHVEVGQADAVEIRVYNVAGEMAHEVTLTGAPALTGGVHAYEHAWDTADVAPGLYLYHVRARRAGLDDLLSNGKLAVLK